MTATLESNKQMIRSIYEDHINTGTLEPVAALVSPAFTTPSGEHGPAAFIANLSELRTGFPDIQFHIEQMIAEADQVVVRWTWHATHTGTFRGIAPTGKPLTNSGIAIYQIVDHKIAQTWVETDRLGALQQMGVVPGPRPR